MTNPARTFFILVALPAALTLVGVVADQGVKEEQAQQRAIARQRAQQAAHHNKAWSIRIGGKCTEVYDGDTITCEIKREMRIRVLDCWAAEIRTKDKAEKVRGLAAKKYLQELIEGEQVEIEIPLQPDARFGASMSMGRVLAHVYARDEDGKRYKVADAMIKAGHATREKVNP